MALQEQHRLSACGAATRPLAEPAGMRRSLQALYGSHRPMTPEDLTEFESAKAKVAANDERSRATSANQLELFP